MNISSQTPFDVREDASCQPERLPEISRGLSAATPPDSIAKSHCTPEGCQRFIIHPFQHLHASGTPSGCFSILPTNREYRRGLLNPRLISSNPSGLFPTQPSTSFDLWAQPFSLSTTTSFSPQRSADRSSNCRGVPSSMNISAAQFADLAEFRKSSAAWKTTFICSSVCAPRIVSQISCRS